MVTYPKVFTDGNTLTGDELDNNIARRDFRDSKGDTLAHNTISIGNSSTSIVAANAARTYLIIRNVSDADVYLGVTGVTTSTGILLKNNQTWITFDTSAVFGVAGAAGKDIRYWEVDS